MFLQVLNWILMSRILHGNHLSHPATDQLHEDTLRLRAFVASRNGDTKLHGVRYKPVIYRTVTSQDDVASLWILVCFALELRRTMSELIECLMWALSVDIQTRLRRVWKKSWLVSIRSKLLWKHGLPGLSNSANFAVDAELSTSPKLPSPNSTILPLCTASQETCPVLHLVSC